MRVFYTITLGCILALIFCISYKRNKDFFSPLCFVPFMMFIRYVPNMATKDYEHFSVINDGNIQFLFFCVLLAITSIAIGYCIGNCLSLEKKGDFLEFGSLGKFASVRVKQWQIMLLYFLGLYARLRVIIMSGGIGYITNNAASAYMSLSDGSGFLSFFSCFALVAIMMELSVVINHYHQGEAASFRNKSILLILMILIYSFTFLIFTSRSPIFELLLYVLFGVNYLWRKLHVKDFFKPRMIILIVISSVLIVVLPSLRTGGKGAADTNSNFFAKLFDEFSYVGRDTFIYDYFDESNYWYGGSYKGLLTSFIPYSLFPQKPVVDDGIYLVNIMNGHSVTPPVPRDNLKIRFSIPFSTPGILFANFGLLGIFFGEFLMGFVYAKTYQKLKEYRNVFWIITYQLVVYQLELSTLSIMQTLVPLVIAFIACRPVALVKKT